MDVTSLVALTPGTRLGFYEILGSLGAGGMGEVYRARDTKLNRDVAIKVLPASLAKDAAAHARFEREAQAVAALSHPNILAIHDFGTADGVLYAATELLEGETLRARLAAGALPARKAVEYGVQIVRGVSAAHGRGIVHRDLKPENVFVTKDGVVKILDFGLAKAPEPPAAGGAGGETRIANTTPGTVLGTVGYMSPEQVRGQALDHRTDIFSFGAILYEMLAGRRAFTGGSQVETMNAILREDPPEFTDVNPTLPPALDRIVRRCLEKEPAERFHSAHDLAIALEAVSSGSSHGTGSMAAASAPGDVRRRRSLSLLTAGTVVVLVAVAAFSTGRLMSGGASEAVTEFVRLTYRRGPIQSAAVAPDGATFIYSARWEGTPLQLYSTRSESPESLPLPYKSDVVSISSKGELALVSNRRNISGFARPGTLSRAPLSGGASRDVLEDVQFADWMPDGSDLAVSRVVDGRFRLEFPIGKVVYETTGWISQLSVSSDGTRVAFLDQPLFGDDRGSVSIVDRSGRKQALPVDCESAQGIAWAPGDKEVWFTCASKGLWRALLAITPGGTLRTLLRVPGSMILGDVTADGSVLLTHNNERRGMVGQPPGEAEARDLSWLDWTQPSALSEDGRTILFTEEGEGGGPGYGIFLRKTDGSPAARLGTGEALALSPDGKWAIAQKLDSAPIQLVLTPTGAGQSRPLTSDDIAHLAARFLPDGKRFIFTGFKPGRPQRLWVQPIDGGAATPITPEGTVGGLIRPDGASVLTRDDAGKRMLYPIDAGAGAPQPITSLDPADAPVRFTADGRGVLVRRPVAGGGVQIFRVDIATGARTSVRTITLLPGTGAIGQLLLTADASGYVYGYGVTYSDLFLVKGLK